MWQDYVIAVVQWTFLVALVPTVLSKTQKPVVFSSLLTGILCITLGATYGSLGLWNGFIPVVLLGFLWLFLAWQRHRLNQGGESGPR